jgi:hypothetical protein
MFKFAIGSCLFRLRFSRGLYASIQNYWDRTVFFNPSPLVIYKHLVTQHSITYAAGTLPLNEDKCRMLMNCLLQVHVEVPGVMENYI